MLEVGQQVPDFTARDQNGDPITLSQFKGKKVVIVGDILHSRVALSNIFALQLQGAEVMVCGPKTLLPKYIKDLGVMWLGSIFMD